METRGTPTTAGNFSGDFQSRTNWSCLLLRNDKRKVNTRPEIRIRLRYVKKMGIIKVKLFQLKQQRTH